MFVFGARFFPVVVDGGHGEDGHDNNDPDE